LPLNQITTDHDHIEDFLSLLDSEVEASRQVEINTGLKGREQRKDPLIFNLFKLVSNDRLPVPVREQFEIINNVIYRRNVDVSNRAVRYLVVPNHLKQTVLNAYHNSDLMVHVGRDKMWELIKARFFWYGMYADVRRWVDSCESCQRKKPSRQSTNGLLEPIETHYPFETNAADIVGPFVKTKSGNKYILVIIDLYTNWVEAAPLKTLESVEVAELIFKLIITRHGCPSRILTDQGTQFTSKLLLNLTKRLGIHKIQASSAHPQTNGKAERFIRFLTNSLSFLIKKGQNDWDEMLDCVLFAHRTTINANILETPFFLMHGRDAVLPSDLLLGRSLDLNEPDTSVEKSDYKINLLATLKHSYESLSLKRRIEMDAYKKFYDKRQKVINFLVGDQVMVF